MVIWCGLIAIKKSYEIIRNLPYVHMPNLLLQHCGPTSQAPFQEVQVAMDHETWNLDGRIR